MLVSLPDILHYRKVIAVLYSRQDHHSFCTAEKVREEWEQGPHTAHTGRMAREICYVFAYCSSLKWQFLDKVKPRLLLSSLLLGQWADIE